MRVGIVTTWFERGAAYVSRQYAKILSDQHSVSVFARGGELYARDDPQWRNNTVTWGEKVLFPRHLGIDLVQFGNWIKEKKIEVVFFNEQHRWDPVLLCKKLNILVGTYVDYYTEETIPFFEIYDFLICNTKRHLSAFSWHPQVFYIPWGTNLSLFHPASDSIRSCQGPVKFFHSSGYNPKRKGSDLVIRAFNELKVNAHLILHSQVSIHKVFPSLSNLFNQLIDQQRITYIEKTVPAPGLYSLGDVYVYPSRLDGLGLTIAEALASGLPVITTDTPPMNEFVNESNGMLIPVFRFYARPDGYYWPQAEVELDTLTKGMESFVQNIDTLMLRKAAARQYAEKFLNWDINARALPEIFSKISRQPVHNWGALRKEVDNFEKRALTIKAKIYRAFPLFFRLLRHACKLFDRGKPYVAS